MDSVSGIGVLDKAVAVLDALERGPRSLPQLVDATGLPRATAHRLAAALGAHGFVARTSDGRFQLGARLTQPGLPVVARPALEELRDATGESVQLYVRRGNQRLCIEALESPHGLRTIVPVGALLPLDAGSAGKVLRAEATALERGWAESVEERQRGVASVSAPVHDDGRLVAAVSVSGPVERTSRAPGRRYAKAVVAAAGTIEAALVR
ncbi:MAG: IclR family transcriptional regulator [Acidimicrobiia bacterium]|nr:IclR family transcriptional regulator [Acidimicrobiia bacterium]